MHTASLFSIEVSDIDIGNSDELHQALLPALAAIRTSLVDEHAARLGVAHRSNQHKNAPRCSVANENCLSARLNPRYWQARISRDADDRTSGPQIASQPFAHPPTESC